MPKQIHTPADSVAPLGPYSVATEANGFVFVSGQIAIDPATGQSVGDEVAAQTRQIMKNIGSLLEGLSLAFDDIVKTTIYLTDMADFAAVNDVYGEYVGEAKPARATVAVAALPGGFRVEIDAIVAR